LGCPKILQSRREPNIYEMYQVLSEVKTKDKFYLVGNRQFAAFCFVPPAFYVKGVVDLRGLYSYPQQDYDLQA